METTQIRESVLSKFSIQLAATNLPGYQTVVAPPHGFDPLKATTEELQKYHFPHRPDPRTSPGAVNAWRKAMSRAHTFVTPQLRPGARRRSSFGRPATNGSHNTSSGWAGTIAAEGSFNEVWGILIVPNAVVPKGKIAVPVGSGAPNYSFSAWVGIDGADGSGDVCQAGIETDIYVDQNGNVTDTEIYAWAEWWPAGTETLNFAISPGDTVAIMIQYLGLNPNTKLYDASVHFSNLTTGVAMTPIILSVPASTLKSNNALFQGNTAEWIVEPPTYTSANINAALPDFGDLIFVDAGAVSQPGGAKGTVIDASKETQTSSVMVNNKIVASVMATPALQISYLATAGTSEDPGYEFPL